MGGQNWRGLKWIVFEVLPDRPRCVSLCRGKFEKRRRTFFQIYQNVIYTASYSLKIILSCFVAVILQMRICK